MTAIHSVEEFMATFKPGDTVWCITSYQGAPDGIEEFLYLDAQEEVSCWPGVKYSPKYGPWIKIRYKTGWERAASVNDLVNSCHGAFTTIEAAEAELALRKQAFASNADWQARVALEIEMDRELDRR